LRTTHRVQEAPTRPLFCAPRRVENPHPVVLPCWRKLGDLLPQKTNAQAGLVIQCVDRAIQVGPLWYRYS
jgi:hypothetical protein